jgi:hypothetical protein
MSTVGEYLRLTPEELNRVLDDPEVIAELVGQFIECEEEVDDSEPRHHDTDVAWAALEFLLDRIGFPVDIVRGEEDIPGASDWGNGPHRYLTSDQVSHAAQALAATSVEALLSGVTAEDLAQADIYPSDFWAEQDSLKYVAGAYEGLVPFVQAAARHGHPILVWLN